MRKGQSRFFTEPPWFKIWKLPKPSEKTWKHLRPDGIAKNQMRIPREFYGCIRDPRCSCACGTRHVILKRQMSWSLLWDMKNFNGKNKKDSSRIICSIICSIVLQSLSTHLKYLVSDLQNLPQMNKVRVKKHKNRKPTYFALCPIFPRRLPQDTKINQGPSIFSLQFASKVTSVPTAKMYKTARSEPFGALRIRNTPALSTMCSLPQSSAFWKGKKITNALKKAISFGENIYIQILANFGTKTDFDWEICGAKSPNSCCSHWRDSHCDPAQIQGF